MAVLVINNAPAKINDATPLPAFLVLDLAVAQAPWKLLIMKEIQAAILDCCQPQRMISSNTLDSR
jgi:hypothetical protein